MAKAKTDNPIDQLIQDLGTTREEFAKVMFPTSKNPDDNLRQYISKARGGNIPKWVISAQFAVKQLSKTEKPES